MNDQTRLVYIASPSFSGSTLLTFLLNAHPMVATIGELKWSRFDLSTYACSCGALLSACRFWAAVVRELGRLGIRFDLATSATEFRWRERPVVDRLLRARLRAPWVEGLRTTALAFLPRARRRWRYIAHVNRAVIGVITRLEGAACFVDASKDPVRLKHLLDSGHYDVRMIHLIRDGRAFTHSAIKNEAVTASHAALEWRRTHAQIDGLGRRLGPHRAMTVKYEDLCADPEDTMGRLFDFIGLPRAEVTSAFRHSEHHILGNRMRLKGEQDIKLDDSWRSRLAASDLDAFLRLSGRENERFGYV